MTDETDYRKCDKCGVHTPDGQGVYWAHYRLRFCRRCSDVLAGYTRDYTCSSRGRFRTKREFLRATESIKTK